MFEIGTEELPAFYVDEGREGLRNLLGERLNAARLSWESLELFSTPRRLAARVRGLAAAQTRLESERRGPSVKAGERAAAGFAASLGLSAGQLTERDGYLYARVVEEGRPALEVLPDLLADVVRDLPAKRKMRWGAVEDCAFVRPVAWLLALLDEDVVPVRVAGLEAGRSTRGHRFLAPDAFEVRSPDSYEAQLREAYVLADPRERREAVVQAAQAALEEGMALEGREALLEEVVNLVEYPFGILGTFDPKYLALPDEVLAETMIVHQRYFPVRVGERLGNRFVVISNNRVPDVSVPLVGYVQVLDGRLSDAKFFWDADLRKSLEEHRQQLAGRAFQKGLGNMLDKQGRVARLSVRLAERLRLEVDRVREATQYFLADLSTQMVYEYADLAGVMGRAYALTAGVAPEVADLLAQGVRPVTAEDPLPSVPEGAVLSLADRADTLTGFFSLGKGPSGSADPFGLRRLGIGTVRELGAFGFDLPVAQLLQLAALEYREADVTVEPEALEAAEAFLWERFSALMTAQGYAPQAVRAARAASGSIYDAAWRVAVLAEMARQPGFEDLTQLYKRAANLSKDVQAAQPSHEAAEHDAERRLIDALPHLEEAVRNLEAAGKAAFRPWDLAEAPRRAAGVDLEGAVGAVTAIKPDLDAFFDGVMVMVDDPMARENRLRLLASVRDAVRRIAPLELLA
nr:glycine--tRNA ligase subunit beta [Deinobacterium chartae]